MSNRALAARANPAEPIHARDLCAVAAGGFHRHNGGYLAAFLANGGDDGPGRDTNAAFVWRRRDRIRRSETSSERILSRETTLIKRDIQRYLRIEPAQGEPFTIREYGVHYYDVLCEKALAHFARHHPAKTAAPPEV